MPTSDIKKGPLYVDSTNNSVGIGTTTNNQSSSTASVTLNAASGMSAYELRNADVFSGYVGNTGTNMYLVNAKNGSLGLYTNNTERMHLTSTGSVGIGTASPSQGVHLKTASGNSYVKAERTTASQGEVGFTTNDWYLYQDNNSTDFRFYTGGSDRMVIDSSGRVTMPSQVGFSAFKVSPFSVTSTGQYVTYTNVDHNVGNHYNSSTGIFTCPIAGRYLVLHSHLTYSNGSGFGIVKNSSFVRQSYVSGGNWQQPAMSTVLNCAANDTIRIYADNNTYLHDNQYGMFSVHLMA